MNYSMFDIVGPTMIGPSSSHTAGAARIGYIARSILGEDVIEVIFYLHGSFGKTYKGHGTDLAILAGVLGFFPDDEQIRDAFDIATKKNIAYQYVETDLGDVHPNTVKITMRGISGKRVSVIGSSIGGGKIQITRIGDVEVEFNGEYATLITEHIDKPGVVAKITVLLASYDVNIAFMRVFRHQKGEKAMLIVETDEDISDEIIHAVETFPYVNCVTKLEKINV